MGFFAILSSWCKIYHVTLTKHVSHEATCPKEITYGLLGRSLPTIVHGANQMYPEWSKPEFRIQSSIVI
jgi:hypothetical protein